MATQVTVFSYQSLDSETRIVVQQKTSEIRGLMNNTVQSVVEIGRKLIEVKEKLGHGQFGGWLTNEFDWSHDTASRFINVTNRFGEISQIAKFAPSALYLLSTPSVPNEAIEEATARAEQGEKITHKTAKAIAEKHKPPAAKTQAKPKKPQLTLGKQVYQFLANNHPVTVQQVYDGLVQQGIVARNDENFSAIKDLIGGMYDNGDLADWIINDEPPTVIVLEKSKPHPPTQEKPPLSKDELGRDIPADLQPVFNAFIPVLHEINNLLLRAQTVWTQFENTLKTVDNPMVYPGPGYWDAKNSIDKLKLFALQFRDAAPYTTCVICKRREKQCVTCNDTGWITKSVYAHAYSGVKAEGSPTLKEANLRDGIQTI